jgi:transposase-like protein
VPPEVRRLVRHLDRWLRSRAGVSDKHLAAYIDEFVFRFNHRNAADRWDLFRRLVGSSFEAGPTYAALTGSDEPLAAAG